MSENWHQASSQQGDALVPAPLCRELPRPGGSTSLLTLLLGAVPKLQLPPVPADCLLLPVRAVLPFGPPAGEDLQESL